MPRKMKLCTDSVRSECGAHAETEVLAEAEVHAEAEVLAEAEVHAET